jgi:hypothetical protein
MPALQAHLLVDVHSLDTTANLHLQLPLALRLRQRLLNLALEPALLGLNLLPPSRNLLLDLLHVDLDLSLRHLLGAEPLARMQQVLVFHDELPVVLALALLVAAHARLVECALPPCADLGDAGHGFERGLDEVAVVADGHVAALGEGERRIHGHLFAVCAAVGLSPGQLPGISLGGRVSTEYSG